LPDFFISRAGADSERAKWIAVVLREAGFDPLFQDEHTPIGRSFYELMEAGAEFRTIAICSDAYFKSNACLDEWRAAYNHRRLIPVRFEEFQSPTLWSTVVYVDLMGKSETEQRVELLARASRGKSDRPPLVSIAKLPAVNATLIGRDRELDLLDDAWTNPRIRLVSFVAFGGVARLRSRLTGGSAMGRLVRAGFSAGHSTRRARARIGRRLPIRFWITHCANGSVTKIRRRIPGPAAKSWPNSFVASRRC
jgi:hypothetical protein